MMRHQRGRRPRGGSGVPPAVKRPLDGRRVPLTAAARGAPEVLPPADIERVFRYWSQLVELARIDPLTGLPNRGVFADAVAHATNLARRDRQRFALLAIDLDHFKHVNDSLGHPVGDLLLTAVAQRLRGCVRENDTVARIGGDEFAILQTELHQPADAALLAAKIIDTLALPFAIEGHDIRAAASVGVAVSDTGAADAEQLLGHADIALYRAKAAGRGTYRFFTNAMDTEVRAAVATGTALRAALAADQLEVLFQPEFELATDRLAGVEARHCWPDAERGLITGADFLAIAARSGLSVAIGDRLLQRACAQGRAWLDAGLLPPTLTVAISPLQLKAPLALQRAVTKALRETGFPPARLELGLPITAAGEVERDHVDVLRMLHEQRVGVALTDAGADACPIDLLHRWPIARLTLAAPLLARFDPAGDNARVVRAVLAVAREFGLPVLAQGVESAAAARAISAWGCAHAQGPHFGRPRRAGALGALLARAAHLPATPRHAAGISARAAK